MVEYPRQICPAHKSNLFFATAFYQIFEITIPSIYFLTLIQYITTNRNPVDTQKHF